MTAAAMTRPSPATVLSAGERARAVAEALLGLADDAGGVEVSQAALAAAAGMDRRTLGRAMGRLEDAGLVSVEEEATPNSPAVYDVGRLVEAAAAEGLVPRRPAEAGAPAQPAPVVRRLSHEEAVDPAGHVVEGGRYLVDPEDLQRGDNIRRDLRSLEAWGYVLADVETDLCEAVEEAADAGDLHTVPTASAGKGTAA